MSGSNQPNESWDNKLRSKGLLPAVGVGAAVYFVTGLVSITTLGMVGIGAGVGYGLGSWIADNYQKKQAEKQGQQQANWSPEELPWALQVSLQQWYVFLSSRAAGCQLTPPQVEQLFAEFEQLEPAHAANVRSIVHSSGFGAQGVGGTPMMQSPGVTVVRTAAEV